MLIYYMLKYRDKDNKYAQIDSGSGGYPYPVDFTEGLRFKNRLELSKYLNHFGDILEACEVTCVINGQRLVDMNDLVIGSEYKLHHTHIIKFRIIAFDDTHVGVEYFAKKGDSTKRDIITRLELHTYYIKDNNGPTKMET